MTGELKEVGGLNTQTAPKIRTSLGEPQEQLAGFLPLLRQLRPVSKPHISFRSGTTVGRISLCNKKRNCWGLLKRKIKNGVHEVRPNQGLAHSCRSFAIPRCLFRQREDTRLLGGNHLSSGGRAIYLPGGKDWALTNLADLV